MARAGLGGVVVVWLGVLRHAGTGALAGGWADVGLVVDEDGVFGQRRVRRRRATGAQGFIVRRGTLRGG